MPRNAGRGYGARIRSELEAAFVEEYTPHQIAASLAIGIFVTALPTLGLGLGLFFVLAYYVSWISKVALFCSVVVLNPLVKPVVYVASYWIGRRLFDPEPTVLFDVVILDRAFDVTRRLLVGNLLVALVLAIVTYVVARNLVATYRRRAPLAADEAQA